MVVIKGEVVMINDGLEYQGRKGQVLIGGTDAEDDVLLGLQAADLTHLTYDIKAKDVKQIDN